MAYPLTYLYLLSFVAMVVLTTVLAVATPPQRDKRIRVAVFVLVTLWVLADLLSMLVDSAAGVQRLAEIFAPVWALLPLAILIGVLRYTQWPGWALRPWALLGLSLPAFGCVALVETGLLYHRFTPASADRMYFVSHATWWQPLVNLYHLGYAFTAAGVLLVSARRIGTEELRTTGRAMLFVLAPLGSAAALVNGGFSPLGLDLPFLGSVFAALACALLGIRMLRSEVFAPTALVRRERDQARDLLSRREAVLSAMPIGVALLALADQRLRYANARFRELFGTDEVELDLQPLQPILAETAAGAEVHGRELEFEGASGRPVMLRIDALRSEYSGEPALLVTARDFTAQRRAEQELDEKRRQLIQAQKMEAIGRLAAGVAHDFNNQLAAILGNAALLEKTLRGSPAALEDLEEIRRAGERARVLIRQLLSFSHQPEPGAEVVDLNAVLDRLGRTLGRLVGAEVELRIQPATEPAWVAMDRAQLEQVLMTLAKNADDAMPDGGTLSYTVRQLQTVHGAEEICVEVQDSGCGMTSEVREHAFEPFFSTKPSQGTGLGLATAYALVRAAQGELELDSAPAEGTRFLLHLPLAAQPATRPPSEVSTPPTSLSGLRVLLVDDEEAVRRALRRMLEDLGCRVLEAAGGDAALARFDRAAAEIDLVLTDMAMPGLDGRELAARLQVRRPQLPVLFMSGHLQEQQRLDQDRMAFIAKPFGIQALGEALAKVAVACRPTGRRVLVVDDEPGLRRLLHALLGEQGWQVVAVATVAEAREVLAGPALSAVLADHHLATEDGMGVLEAAAELQPGALRVLMSGNRGRPGHDRTPGGAVLQHLSKPFEAEQLEQMLLPGNRTERA